VKCSEKDEKEMCLLSHTTDMYKVYRWYGEQGDIVYGSRKGKRCQPQELVNHNQHNRTQYG